jgi:hypothetical protein
MIDDLDEVLRQLLIREMPIKNGEIDIAFDQPRREWSARLSRPTLNLFLHDLNENKKLRQAQPMWEVEMGDNGQAVKRRKPVRMDLHYMITAWANEPEDEHRLLSRTLMALFRFPTLPEELLPETLQNQPVPIPLMVAQEEELRNPADLWSAMDNEQRPSISCIVTLALNPYQPVTGPLVRTRELRIGPSRQPQLQQLDDETEPDQFWTIGGRLRSAKPLEEVRLTLVEMKQDVLLQPEGRFVVGNLKAGHYTLDVTVKGRKLNSYKVTVPSPDYDLEL